jgi:hypothetical protein
MITRRNLIASSALIPAGALLARCAGTTSVGTISQQLINDVNAGITTGLTTTALLGAMVPPVLTAVVVSAITSLLKQAQSAMSGVTAVTPVATGATTMQAVDGYINSVLTTLASVPVIPPPYNLAIAALALVAPEVEAFVASALGTVSATAPAWGKLANPAVTTLAQARAVMGAAVVE